MEPVQGENSAGSATIFDATQEDFAGSVLATSQQIPVIVDFWADWCSPCKQLMPLLEAQVRAMGGKIVLAKVNADENQALCGQLRVQSLPTVMAFWQGQPIDGFQGALPESQLKQFLEGVLEKTGAGASPMDQYLDQAEQLLEAGDAGTALQLVQQILGAEPDNARAAVCMAEGLHGLGETDQLREYLEQLPDSVEKDADLKARVQKIRAALELAAQAEDAGDVTELQARIDADPMDHQARFDLALAWQARGDMAAAAESLLASIMRDREWNEAACRVQLLKLFEAAGPNDPFTLKYRRRLSSVLFS